MKRIGISYDRIAKLLENGESTDMIIWQMNDQGRTENLNLQVSIRIKDNKYEGTDFSRLHEVIWKKYMDELARGFGKKESYRQEVINGIPFGIFENTFSRKAEEVRCFTVIDGDLIYVFLQSDDEITSEDTEFLRKVLESITVVR